MPCPPSWRRRIPAVVAAGVAGSLVVTSPASAHTGLPAGGALDGVIHPLVGLDHLLAMVAVGILAAAWTDRSIAWLVPAGFVAGMILGGVAGLVGFEIPGVEAAIAASVVVLGVLIMTGIGARGVWLPILAAVFGAIHGHAHGAELPDGALPFAYIVGFVVTTAALHAAGTGVGLGLRRLPAIRVATGALVSTAGALLLLGG